MNSDDQNFLLYVKDYCSKRPAIAAYVGQYASAGVEEKLHTSRAQYSTLEIALYAALSKRRFKGIEKLIIDRIKDSVALGINYIRWDSFIEEYEKDEKK